MREDAAAELLGDMRRVVVSSERRPVGLIRRDQACALVDSTSRDVDGAVDGGRTGAVAGYGHRLKFLPRVVDGVVSLGLGVDAIRSRSRIARLRRRE